MFRDRSIMLSQWTGNSINSFIEIEISICRYCGGEGLVDHDEDWNPLEEPIECPRCDGSGTEEVWY